MAAQAGEERHEKECARTTASRCQRICRRVYPSYRFLSQSNHGHTREPKQRRRFARTRIRLCDRLASCLSSLSHRARLQRAPRNSFLQHMRKEGAIRS